jgi:beta-lactamase superfamily II metal-dependent hydrolase
MAMDRTPPANDEIEFSVFGRGFGEGICVHMGDGEWMLVDSCIEPTSGAPATLHYLASLGIAPDRVVRLIVATHWHDDHVRGISRCVQTCTRATVVCSAALRRNEIFAFVLQQQRVKGALGSGLDEFHDLLQISAERGRPIVWAKANLPIHPRPPGVAPRVVALSPSEDAFERSLLELVEAAVAARSTLPRRYRAPEGPNGASVVTHMQNGPISLLLGADLEVSPNIESGWDAVITYSRPPIRASAVKIPHHGSVSAHSDRMWSDLLDDQALAVLTPWIRGLRHLPTDDDLNRLKKLSTKVYLTALPARVLSSKKVDKIVKRLHGAPIKVVRGWGHVRARRKLMEAEWRVELDGEAVAAGS